MPTERIEELLSLDASAGPARQISNARADDLVARALAAASVPARTPAHRLRTAAAAAIAILAAGGAVAAIRMAAVASRRSDAPALARPAVPSSGPAAPAFPAIALAPVPAPAVAPAPAEPPRASAVASRTRREPEDLLRAANGERALRRWREAEALYARVLRTFPDTDAAGTAAVAAGALRLEHLGDARGALALYRTALRIRPRGPLAEEARWGIAEACRALGDAAGEERALREFVASHPDSLNRGKAEARLGGAGGGR